MSAAAKKKLVGRRLAEKHRAYTGGNRGALLDALLLCGDEDLPLPVWAGQALATMLMDVLKGDLIPRDRAKRGQQAKWLRKHRSDMVDYARACMVEHCRKHGIRWDDVYDAAMYALQGDIGASKTARAIEASYKRVRVREKVEPSRYHILSRIRASTDGSPPSEVDWQVIERMIKDGRGRPE